MQRRCGLLIFLTVDFWRKPLFVKIVRKLFHIRVFYCNKKPPPHTHKERRKRKKNGGEGGGGKEGGLSLIHISEPTRPP